MTNQPHLAITALGHSGSGKTTFLLGMYAVMSGGLHGYFLNAVDLDVDRDLARKWERLLDDGNLPPPNSNTAIPYEFDFLEGIHPLLRVDWLDYRGGALDDEAGGLNSDVVEVQERLKLSDSIYLVLEGSYIAAPVTSSTKLPILRQAGLRRMTALLQASVQQRVESELPLPSVVILITKADLVPRERRGQMDAIVEDVRALLPICFSTGLSTLVCPVQLGDFGLVPTERVSTHDIAPRHLHKPIIFSLAEYMRQLSFAAAEGATSLEARRASLSADMVGMRSGPGALLRRSAISAAESEVAGVEEQIHSLRKVQQIATFRASALFADLAGLPIFRNGYEVGK